MTHNQRNIERHLDTTREHPPPFLHTKPATVCKARKMSLTFYHVPFSTSNVTAAVLDELEYGRSEPLAKRVQFSIKAGDTRAPEYLSTVNPNGRVPAILHEGVSVWESAAITMYLGETFGVAKDGDADQPSLYPALGPKRGEAMKWIVWANVNLAAAGSRLAAALPRDTPGGVERGSRDDVEQNEKVKADGDKAREDFAKWLGVLDKGLEGKEYLLGQNYSLADTHVFSFVRWTTMLKVDLSPYAHIKAWFAKVEARPALKG
ncbi:hypothetical protein MMC29_007552 [Sticta canariensis]|nr:hypothetical protein [Sticta canariensis]